jgi:glycerol-3-phosphate cytidylyltransferase
MIKGLIAGNFDVIHPGYIKTFKECKENCDHFTVLLHSDPSIERPNKLKPILSIEERIEILSSIKYIDKIKVYTYEKELIELLKSGEFNIRFLGDDYINKKFTGDHLNIKLHFINRDHGWSTTKYKKLISKSIKKD